MRSFLLGYAPNRQMQMCKDKRECYFSNTPTLDTLNKKFADERASVAWLIPQLTDLASFANCKQTMQSAEIRQCAHLISNEYSHLKVTEVMLFFYNFKLGKYGKFYGAVSPLDIMTALRVFISERNDDYFLYGEQEKEQRWQQEKRISYKQWQERKQQLQINDNQQ